MHADRDTTRLVRSWLEEGATALPDRVLDAVLDQVPATPQRSAWWPARRSNGLNTFAKLLIAAAAVVVVVVVGLNILPRERQVGGPGPTPSPSPSPTPTATPIALSAGHVNLPIAAGSYHVPDSFSVPFSITFGSDWIPKAMTPGDIEFVKTTPAEGAVWITLDMVDGVYSDPCRAESGPTGSPATSTIDGLTEALTHMVGFPAGPVTDVQIGGHPAKAFVLTNAIDTTTAGCTYGQMLPILHFVGGGDGGGTNGGATEHIWVVDVNGTPVVIDGESFPTTPAADVDEMKANVASIVFE